MSRRALFLAASAVASFGALSCGDVPTLDNGIAYISTIVLPAPAVAAGDQLRDSLGNVAPLRVIAYDRNNAEIPGVTASFLPTSVPVPITIGEDGVVTASDTVSTVQTVLLVARVGDKLQTTTASLLVVSQPDSIARSVPEIKSAALPVLDTLGVAVSGVNSRGTRVAVPGIIVRYLIAGVYGTDVTSGTAVLTLDGKTVSRPDSLFAVDTTDQSGAVSRTLVVAGTGIDSVVVFARARSLNGMRLRGDSLHFVLRVTH